MTAPDLRVLGPATVEVAGRAVAVPRGRQELVLAHLVVRRGEVVSTARLGAALWGATPPEDPANALQYVVARLRRLLEPDRRRGERTTLRREGDGYLLDVAALQTDVGRLEDAVVRARAGDPSRLDGALAGWRGTPFTDHLDDLVLAGEARRLEQLAATATELWAEAGLAAGRADEVADRLTRTVTRSWARLHEGLHRALAAAHHQLGRQVDALAALDDLRTRLAEELGLDPSPELDRLRSAILRGGRPVRPTRPGPSRPPVPPDELVGRDGELGDLAAAAARARLVTLAGPAGVGKTRLAAEFAPTAGGEVAWIELQAVRAPGLVSTAVAAGIGLQEDTGRRVEDVLVDGLTVGPDLLVLDGVEHLVDEVAELVGSLLRLVPRLRVLVTSRTRLDLRGEHVLVVPPLSVPGHDGVDAWTSPAIALLVARTAALDPGFEADADTLPALVEIVRAVDGLPLGIELAAGRARVLGVATVARRLRETLDVLAVGERDRPARHRTLGAALDWSLDQLDPVDREAFSRLAVLSSFDLVAAEQVADVASLDQLTRLVDRSLLRADPVTGRFGVLAPLRAHVWAGLDPDTARAAVDRLLAWVEELVTVTCGELRGPRQLDALRRLEPELPNVRTALTVCLAGDAPPERIAVAQRLVESLSRYWDWRGRFAEANLWSERVFARVADAELPPGGALLAWAAFAASEVGDHERADALVARAVASDWTESDSGLPGGLTVRAVLRRRRGDLVGAASDARAVLEAGEAAGTPWSRAWAHDALAHTAAAGGDPVAAAAHAQRSLALFQEAGDLRGIAWARTALADAVRGGSGARAAALAAVAATHDVGDARSLAWALELFLATVESGGHDVHVLERRRGVVAQLRATPVAEDESDAFRAGRRAAAAWELDDLLPGGAGA